MKKRKKKTISSWVKYGGKKRGKGREGQRNGRPRLRKKRGFFFCESSPRSRGKNIPSHFIEEKERSAEMEVVSIGRKRKASPSSMKRAVSSFGKEKIFSGARKLRKERGQKR